MVFTDPDQVDGIMQKWKTEATKKMWVVHEMRGEARCYMYACMYVCMYVILIRKTKPQTVAKPIKLDEMAETIGEKFTDTSDRKQKGKGENTNISTWVIYLL